MEPGHHHFIDRLAIIAAILSAFALMPQVWVTLSTGNTEGISVVTFSIIGVNSIIWLAYSLHRGLLALGLASLVNIFSSTILLTALFWFMR